MRLGMEYTVGGKLAFPMSDGKEVRVMATLSIFSNVKITDPRQAEKFINALDQSAKEPKRQPSAPVGPYLTDKQSIKALMAKREQKKK